MGAGRAYLDLLAMPEVNRDAAEERAVIPSMAAERYVDPANDRLISRQAGEQPVLGVGSKLVGDDGVAGRQQHAHIAVKANGGPETGLSCQFIRLHLAPERDRADMKSFRRSFPVALVTLEGSSNQIAFL
jgi:hypothetical protein